MTKRHFLKAFSVNWLVATNELFVLICYRFVYLNKVCCINLLQFGCSLFMLKYIIVNLYKTMGLFTLLLRSAK